MHLHFWSKRDECPGKRTAKSDKPNEKQILSGQAGFWLKQVSAILTRRMHAGLVIGRQGIGVSRHPQGIWLRNTHNPKP
jgi:hypothetical protein